MANCLYRNPVNFAFTFFGLFLMFAMPSKSELDRPKVETEHGTIRGTWMPIDGDRNIEAFLSIPYAKPPVGDLRFKEPQSREPWSDEFDASKRLTVEKKCLQMDLLTKSVVGSEDCLYLNVYTPSSTPEQTKYPVLVFLHGGAFISGSAVTENYGPDKLLKKDIILVTLQYRLGFLGFGGMGDGHFPGNYGLKDQLFALKWVKRNIKKFGGDEEKITLFGHGSGAASVHYHLLSPGSIGFFHQAIMMSGSAFCPWARSVNNEGVTKKMSGLVNCHDVSSKEIVECLRKISDAKVFVTSIPKFQTIWRGKDPATVFRPPVESIHDPEFFYSNPKEGGKITMPTILGASSSEGTFAFSILKSQLADGSRGLRPISETLKELNDKFKEIYPVAAFLDERNGEKNVELAEEMKKKYFQDKAITTETIPNLINLFNQELFLKGINETIDHSTGAYVYKFEYEGSFSVSQVLSGDRNFKEGVCHGDDLFYLFPIKSMATLRGSETEADKAISEKMVLLINNFVYFGNPTQNSELLNWEKSEPVQRKYLSIKKDGKFEMLAGFPGEDDSGKK